MFPRRRADDLGEQTTWATGCSGTDSPHWCFEAIQDAFRNDSVEVSFRHLASAEHNIWKQRFLQAVSSPRRLVSDVFDLSALSPHGIMSGERFKPSLELTNCGQCLAGFVYKTVSCLNPDREVARRAVTDTSTSTGGTLWAMILFAERCRPKTMILENVMGLRRGGQDVVVRDRLSAAGYASLIIATTPLASGFPQDRPRLFFLAIRRDLLARQGITDSRFEGYAHGLVSALADKHPAVDFDSCLLPEDDDFAMQMKKSDLQEIDRRALMPFKRARTSNCGNWVEKHKELAANSCRSNWNDNLTESYPAYRLLPDRIKDLLDFHSCAFPDPRVGAWNVSQSQPTLGKGHCPCITPKALFWLPHRGRRMYGREAMSLQGMYMSDWGSVADIADDRFLMELAGNAFCTVSMLPLQMALLATLARFLGVSSTPEAPMPLPFEPVAPGMEAQSSDGPDRTERPEGQLPVPADGHRVPSDVGRRVQRQRRDSCLKRPAACG